MSIQCNLDYPNRSVNKMPVFQFLSELNQSIFGIYSTIDLSCSDKVMLDKLTELYG